MYRINQCLNKQLETIYHQSIQLDSFNELLRPFLPVELQDTCTVTSFVKGRLVLSVDNASKATLLRFCLPNLRDKLRTEAHLYQLGSITIDIKQPIHLAPLLKQKKKKKGLSKTAQSAVLSAADASAYLPLKEALLRLAANLSEP